MLRVFLGAFAGFIVWTIFWVGSDSILSAISPGWYGAHQRQFGEAVNNQTPFAVDSTILILGLIRAAIFSLIAGFVAASIARENTIAPFVCGVLLLGFGIFIQYIFWNYVPLWYHIPFLLMLIPATLAGGKLRKNAG